MESTRLRSVRCTCTSTWLVEAGLPCLAGRDLTSRTGAVTNARTSTDSALAMARSETNTACRLSGTDPRLARVHMGDSFQRKNTSRSEPCKLGEEADGQRIRRDFAR